MIRRHLAVTVSVVILLGIALGGAAYAAWVTPPGSVTVCVTTKGFVRAASSSNACPSNTTKALISKDGLPADGAITESKLGNDAVTSEKIKDGEVKGVDVDESTLVMPPIGWQPYPLDAGFAPYGEGFEDPRLGKDLQGIVRLEGSVRGIFSGTNSIGTLPVGYRPASTHRFAIACNADSGYGARLIILNIDPDGEVKAFYTPDCNGTAGNTFNGIVLDGVTFQAG